MAAMAEYAQTSFNL
jgi:hypothetical protein